MPPVTHCSLDHPLSAPSPRVVSIKVDPLQRLLGILGLCHSPKARSFIEAIQTTHLPNEAGRRPCGVDGSWQYNKTIRLTRTLPTPVFPPFLPLPSSPPPAYGATTTTSNDSLQLRHQLFRDVNLLRQAQHPFFRSPHRNTARILTTRANSVLHANFTFI